MWVTLFVRGTRGAPDTTCTSNRGPVEVALVAREEARMSAGALDDGTHNQV